MAPSVTIVVLNWNRAGDTLDCLASLRKVHHAPLQILAVDNGSTDNSVDRVRAEFPEIPVIRNAGNLGFAEGNNVGIRRALADGCDFVMLLNNDTVMAPECVTALLDAADSHPRASFLGAKIFYHDAPDRIWMGKPVWDPRTCRFTHVGIDQPDAEAGLNAVSEAAYACGCAVLVRAAAIREIGLMDPRFFCYFEEVDWCFRAARRGWSSLYVPAAHVWHKVAASSGGTRSPLVAYYRTRNRLLWASRHLTRRQRLHVLRDQAADAFSPLGWRESGARARLQRMYWNLLTIQRDPLIQARLLGMRDYLGRRFGPAPPAIHALTARSASLSEPAAH